MQAEQDQHRGRDRREDAAAKPGPQTAAALVGVVDLFEGFLNELRRCLGGGHGLKRGQAFVGGVERGLAVGALQAVLHDPGGIIGGEQTVEQIVNAIGHVGVWLGHVKPQKEAEG